MIDSSSVELIADIFATSYILIGAIFGILGWRYYARLKICNPYLSFSTKMRIFLSIGIVLTVFEFRGIYVFIKQKHDFAEDWVKHSLKHNLLIYPIYSFCYVTLVTIVPSINQIISIKIILDQKDFNSPSQNRISRLLAQDEDWGLPPEDLSDSIHNEEF
mmetsp:Transcript_31420/g.27770  ORF Transcript_31420/g.27770 Transcript_31420/m.27770 type:complete len:160 (+) Transcript_31420:506-985(+)